MKSRQFLGSTRRHSNPRYKPYLDIFTSVLGIEGKPFGQLNQLRFGISDDAHGTQWNLALAEGDVKAYLGVNLEGLEDNGWPIATLLLSELKNPSLEKLKSRIGDPDSVDTRLTRDAWEITRRPKICNSIDYSKLIPEEFRQIVADARLHDLRHAHSLRAVMNGESLHMARQLLGHRRASTSNRYVHLYDATLSQAAERVAEAIHLKSGMSV